MRKTPKTPSPQCVYDEGARKDVIQLITTWLTTITSTTHEKPQGPHPPKGVGHLSGISLCSFLVELNDRQVQLIVSLDKPSACGVNNTETNEVTVAVDQILLVEG